MIRNENELYRLFLLITLFSVLTIMSLIMLIPKFFVGFLTGIITYSLCDAFNKRNL